MLIYIYSPLENTRRLNYIARHIFNELMLVEFSIIKDKNAFLKQKGVCINYSKENLKHGLWIFSHGLLFEKGVQEIKNLEISQWKGYFCFFRQTSGDIPFDLFAASFYLLTLYEEYYPKQLDEHGRFDPNESQVYRKGFLETPLIDRWSYLLKEDMKIKYPDLKFEKRKFRFVSTCDVDYPYKYLKKGLIRSVGGMMRDLRNGQLKEIAMRIAVHLRIKPDPYMDALRWIDRVHQDACKPYRLFALMEDRGKYGRKTLYPLKTYYRYLKNLDSVTVGLHPSYDTYFNPKQLLIEKKRLEKALGKDEIATSRQHFLRMHVPETFRMLEEAGFREDYTIAFAHAPGFRSGTAVPHHFYDVEKDTIGELMLHPTIVMDACLITHLGLSPEEALEKIKRLLDECMQSGGEFIILWHNSNLSGNSKNNPWINVFIESFRYAVSQEKNTFAFV